MKKILALLLAVVMVFALAACGGNNDDAKDDFKVGFIFLHDKNSTYDKNFMDAAAAVQKELGLTDEQVLYKINIPESNECYEAALELVDAGCDVIFGDSFGFESHLLKAAQEHPEVQFCHATGTNAKTAGVANYHNAFASIYEGRYLAGIVIEKAFQQGGELIRSQGIRVESLARVESMTDDGKITFCE